MIIFVVGLYKSGTSMVATLLEQMGCASIVDRVATTQGLTQRYNIQESYEVNLLNNEILDRYSKGCIYYSNQDLPNKLDPDLMARIEQIVSKGADQFLFIKDPRLIGTLKYWIEACYRIQPYRVIYVNREQGLEQSMRVDSWFQDKIVDGDYAAAIASLKANYYNTKRQFIGPEVNFDVLKHYPDQLKMLLYNHLTAAAPLDAFYTIYFHDYFLPSKPLTDLFKLQTPAQMGVWHNIVAVDKVQEADFEIVQDKTDSKYDTSKLIFLGREPSYVYPHDIPEAKYNFHHTKGNTWLPQTWWVKKPYDELKSNPEDPSTAKTRLLSVIDSGKRHTQQHSLRLDCIDKLVQSGIEMDIFGKTQQYVNSPRYRGTLPERDKTNGLQPYRFNLAIENGSTEHYFSEKFCDPILCNTFPIYYGCSRIDQYFPKGSYFLIDPAGDVVQQVRAILEIPTSQLDYKALAEARALVLDKYNLWSTIHTIIQTGKLL